MMSDNAIARVSAEDVCDLPNISSSSDDAVKHYAIGLFENEELAKVRIRVLRDHTDSVNSCGTFNGGQAIITASDDHSVKIWNFKNGHMIKSYDNLHPMAINEARANNEGTRIVSCGWDKMVNFWDLETGKCLWKAAHEGVVTCCKLSYDDKLICSGSDMDNTVKIADTRMKRLVHNLEDFHKSTVTSCIFSFENNKVITTSMDRTTKFFDLRTATNTITLKGHINVVAGCAITRNERNFATASWDKMIQLWDIATGMYRSNGPITLSGSHEGSVSSCSFTADGLLLVTGGFDNSIVVWDADNHVVKLKMQGHLNWINDVAFSQDEKWLISCSKDHTVRLWNIEDSDKIPAVLENRKSIGLKIISCSKCNKPFSMAQLDSSRDITVCVFCRLQNPDKPWLEIEEPEV